MSFVKGRGTCMVRVQIVWWQGKVFHVKDCQFNEPCTVKEAIDYCELSYSGNITCYGQKIGLDGKVADGDRIEVHSKVLIDPMVARKIRHKLRKQKESR